MREVHGWEEGGKYEAVRGQVSAMVGELNE